MEKQLMNAEHSPTNEPKSKTPGEAHCRRPMRHVHVSRQTVVTYHQSDPKACATSMSITATSRPSTNVSLDIGKTR